MQRGDVPILAALLGVGIVMSPLVVGRAREVPVAVPGIASRPEPAPMPAATAADAAPSPKPAPQALPREVAPGVREAVGTPFAVWAGVTDRPFSLLLGDRGLHDATRLDGPLVLDGRPLLVHVAASWCTPCVDDLPAFLALAADAPRVVFVAAEDVAGPSGLANAFEALLAKAEPTSRALPRGLELRADPAWAWPRWLGHDSLPLTAVIDARGGLVLVVEGPLDRDTAARVRTWLGAGS